MWWQPFLLTVANARGLQYWAEKLNPPDSSNFHPLVGSVIELKEMDLGRIDQRAMNQGPQTSLSCGVMLPLVNKHGKPNTGFTEASTQTISQATTNAESVRYTTPPVGMEGENWYLLVVTASIQQLSLESAGNGLEGSLTALHGGDTFQNPEMAAVLLGSTRAVSYGGATVKELEE